MRYQLTFIGQYLLVVGVMFMEAGSTAVPGANSLEKLRIFDWDLAISQGNGAVLMSLSTNESVEFEFPMPKPFVFGKGNESQDTIKVVSLDGDLKDINKVMTFTYPLTYPQLEREWEHFEVKDLASDPTRNLLYFVHILRAKKHVMNLGVFNLTSQETTLLLQTSEGFIERLNLYKDDVYFIHEERQAIMKLETSGESFTGENFLLPIVIKQFYGYTVPTGFSFAFDGTLYYSTKYPSTISYITKNEDEKTLISSNLNKPDDLQLFDDRLYFMNMPHSTSERTIERVDRYNASIRDTLIDFGSHDHFIPTTFTVTCGILFWNDAASKALWKMPLPLYRSKVTATSPHIKVHTSTKVNRHSTVLFPYSVISRQFLDQLMCRAKGINSPLVDFEMEEISPQRQISIEKAAAKTIGSDILGENIKLKTDGNEVLIEKAVQKTMPEIKQTSTTSTPPTHLIPVRKVEFCSDEESELSCLNGATCLYLETNLFCLCLPGFSGPKCELDWEKGIVNTTLEKVSALSQSCSSPNQTFLLLITTCLSGLVVALIVILIILTIKVRRLRCNPKINRRLVVSRPASGRLRHTSLNVCEMIDIENCCDMTICETPCYDSGTGEVSLLKDSQKSQDKECLIAY